MKTLLTIENLQVKYDNSVTLENVNFKIKENTFITIIGPNGGGKTTLVKSILGFITPTQGKIIYSKNLKIGYVPQKNNFEEEFPINVKTVILSGILNKKIKLFHSYSKKDKEILKEVLKRVNIEKLECKQINELSGGELQKVLLARAIISNPNLLILDEPFSNIDTSSTKEYYELLETLSKTMSILIISHDIGAITSYTDDVICVNKLVHYHEGSKLSNSDIQNTYGCPIDLIGHGIPHRIFPTHIEGGK
jgi:zinc transport system ATP-binding protein